MSIGHTLLGLLESSPRHVYDRTRTFDDTFGHARPRKNKLVEVDRIEAGRGPERKRCAITGAGAGATATATDVRRSLTRRDAAEILGTQRSEQLHTTRAVFYRGAHPEALLEAHPHRPMPTTTRLDPLREAVTR
ncbi:PadR family transcriptional regulator [Streptomyces sp. TUS-ST3]|uniref:PadR family transcriptional regulator n=1 Tax=Streptomyces sp. TUS-ST3 TaxID=3025591 RepID=UPI00235B54F0|nr:PadR family transcriptional regulator [Streptomyces sp. TUS-ST3]GLP69148.1 PadR family transcriptional regulator [Streptomyces sp. TUS-ST3]